MLKKLYNKRYFTISLYALFVIAVCSALAAILSDFPAIQAALSGVFAVLRPILYALVLSYFCNPLMRLAEKYVFRFLDKRRCPKKLKRVLSLVLSYLVILLVIAGMLALAVPEIVNNYESLIRNLTDFILKAIEKADAILISMNIGSLSTIIRENSDKLLQAVAQAIAAGGVSLILALFTVSLTVILSFVMLLYKETWTANFKRFCVACLPSRLYYNLDDILRYSNRTFGRYLLGSVFDSLLVGIETFTLLMIFGVPYPALVSILVGCTNIIPYFGPFIGAIPSAIIIMTQDVGKAILFCFLILVVQQIDGNLINPRIVGKTVSMDSMWVIIAITVFGGWFGVVGLIIAIPLFAVLYMLLKRWTDKRLRKRRLPLDRDHYVSLYSVSQGPIAPQEPKNTEETTEGGH